MALEAPPHQRLVDLMGAQHERGGGQQEVIAPSPQVPTGIDTDGGDDETAGEVTFRREAHTSNVALFAVATGLKGLPEGGV